ncbi:MAG: carbohydrate kinase family protein [Planctomycetales bacterium]|nr:carbohydrate kinase family protein [Planctomycetales bacterium]
MQPASDDRWDCIVCGSCTVDIIVRPISLHTPIGSSQLHRTEPIVATTGGLVSNSGAALARLGMRTLAFSQVGDDPWGEIIRKRYQSLGVDATGVATNPDHPSSVTVVMVDSDGERSFAHSQGAPKTMDVAYYRQQLSLFAQSRVMLLGYYSLLPQLEHDLPELLQEIRSTGCLTALDAAGQGGSMSPLDRILPQLDFYVPSRNEAEAQTGERDPERMIRRFRDCGAAGVVGVKLGSEGALLADASGQLHPIAPIAPPAPIVDTTGAGDAFYAGLLAGQLLGWSLERSGQLAAAVGAWCTTGAGASAALPTLEQAMALLEGR